MYILAIISASLLFGLIFGVIIGITSYRLPLGLSVFKPPFCASCNHSLGVLDVVPILSFFALGGKCRYCKTIIPLRYLVIELTTATLFVLNYFAHPYDLQQIVILDLITATLLAIMISDLESGELSDSVLLFLAGLGMIYTYLTVDDAMSLLILPTINFAVALLICFLFKLVFKKEAMVSRDLKLLFISGLFLSVENISSFYIMIGMFGVLIGIHWKERQIASTYPLGPAICISLYFCTLFGKSLDLTLFIAF